MEKADFLGLGLAVKHFNNQLDDVAKVELLVYTLVESIAYLIEVQEVVDEAEEHFRLVVDHDQHPVPFVLLIGLVHQICH